MTSDLNMYATLLSQSLFQGMSQSDLEQVVGHTHFDFSNVSALSPIAVEGSRCESLLFITHGTLTATATSDDHSYTLSETLPTPWVIEPERLFGLTPRYARTYTAQSNCRLFGIGKDEVVSLSSRFDIFRINLLNIYTTHAQRVSRQCWRTPPHDIKAKLARFVSDHSLRLTGEKVLDVKMTVLASLLGESRLNLSRALHELSSDGLIAMSRGQVRIPHLEKLLTGYL